jgi:hypothetical protein
MPAENSTKSFRRNVLVDLICPLRDERRGSNDQRGLDGVIRVRFSVNL